MAKILVLSALFFLSLSFVSGAENPVSKTFTDMLTGTYTDNVSELPAATNLHPNTAWQSKGHISAWIDIVGFKDMIRENSVDYVPGNPAYYAIVQSDARANLNCDGCSVDSLTQNVSVSTAENMTVATLTVNLVWSQTICSDAGGSDSSDDGSGESGSGSYNGNTVSSVTFSPFRQRTLPPAMVWRLDDSSGDSGDSGASGDSGGGSSCTTSKYSESATFTTSTKSPIQYPQLIAIV